MQDACEFIKKETPASVFSCGFSKIFRVNFFAGHMQIATSEISLLSNVIYMFSDFSEKITLNCKSKGNPVHLWTDVLFRNLLRNLRFFKDVFNKTSLTFAFTVSLAGPDIKNRFHCLKCLSQVAAKSTKNKLQTKKVICS